MEETNTNSVLFPECEELRKKVFTISDEMLEELLPFVENLRQRLQQIIKDIDGNNTFSALIAAYKEGQSIVVGPSAFACNPFDGIFNLSSNFLRLYFSSISDLEMELVYIKKLREDEKRGFKMQEVEGGISNYLSTKTFSFDELDEFLEHLENLRHILRQKIIMINGHAMLENSIDDLLIKSSSIEKELGYLRKLKTEEEKEDGKRN